MRRVVQQLYELGYQAITRWHGRRARPLVHSDAAADHRPDFVVNGANVEDFKVRINAVRGR
jgi:hypothetical protein